MEFRVRRFISAIKCGCRVGFILVVGGCSQGGYAPGLNYASPALVQYIAPGYHAPTATTATLSQAETAGNFLVAAAYWDYYPTVTVHDSLSNTWASLPIIHTYCPMAGNYYSFIQIWYATNIFGGTNAVTVTESGSPLGATNNGPGVFVLEYSGISNSAPLDTYAGQAAPSSSVTMSAGNLTPANKDLIVAFYMDNNGGGTMLGGTNYTRRATDTAYFSMIEDNVNFSILPFTTINPTGLLQNGGDNCWIAEAAAFSPAAQ